MAAQKLVQNGPMNYQVENPLICPKCGKKTTVHVRGYPNMSDVPTACAHCRAMFIVQIRNRRIVHVEDYTTDKMQAARNRVTQLTAAQNASCTQWVAVEALVRKNVERLGYLRARWADEKEYEDFNDYIAEIRKMFPEHELSGFRKNPITFRIKIDGGAHDMLVKVLAGSVSWKVA